MDTLTTTQAAEYCGVHFRTVIRWINKGLLVAFKLPGRGDNRVLVQDLANFMLENDMPIPDDLLERLADQEDDFANPDRSVLWCSAEDDWHFPLSEALQGVGISYSRAQNSLEFGYRIATHGGLVCVDVSHFPLNPQYAIQWLSEVDVGRRHDLLLIQRSRVGGLEFALQQGRMRNCSVMYRDDVSTVAGLVESVKDFFVGPLSGVKA